MLKETARFLKVLGDETRLRIVKHLISGEACSCEFMKVTGRAQSTVSKHLNDMEKIGILKSRRVGNHIHYSIRDNRVKKLFSTLKVR